MCCGMRNVGRHESLEMEPSPRFVKWSSRSLLVVIFDIGLLAKVVSGHQGEKASPHLGIRPISTCVFVENGLLTCGKITDSAWKQVYCNYYRRRRST